MHIYLNPFACRVCLNHGTVHPPKRMGLAIHIQFWGFNNLPVASNHQLRPQSSILTSAWKGHFRRHWRHAWPCSNNSRIFGLQNAASLSHPYGLMVYIPPIKILILSMIYYCFTRLRRKWFYSNSLSHFRVWTLGVLQAETLDSVGLSQSLWRSFAFACLPA